jgi:hypothetical protein
MLRLWIANCHLHPPCGQRFRASRTDQKASAPLPCLTVTSDAARGSGCYWLGSFPILLCGEAAASSTGAAGTSLRPLDCDFRRLRFSRSASFSRSCRRSLPGPSTRLFLAAVPVCPPPSCWSSFIVNPFEWFGQYITRRTDGRKPCASARTGNREPDRPATGPTEGIGGCPALISASFDGPKPLWVLIESETRLYSLF